MALNFKPLQYEPGGSMYAPRIGEETWNLYRPQIEQLYIGHGKTLDEVMAVMAQDHNFRPTESQYKIQFRRWKLRKNRVGGIPPPQKVGLAALTDAASIRPSSSSSTEQSLHAHSHHGSHLNASPSISAMSLSPQTTLRGDISVASTHSPGSIVSSATEVPRSPDIDNSAPVQLPSDTSPLDVTKIQSLLSDVREEPMDPSQAAHEFSIHSQPDTRRAGAISPDTIPDAAIAQATDDDLLDHVGSEPPSTGNSHMSDEGSELDALTGSLLDCLITIASDPLKIAELNDEGGFWMTLVAKHLCSTLSNDDPMNPCSVILQALFKYKQANVFYPNAKMSTMSVLSEIAPTTDARDLVQQIGWLYSAKARAEGGDHPSNQLNAHWLMGRSYLGHLYRIRGQPTEASKLSAGAVKSFRKYPNESKLYKLLATEHLHLAFADRGDPQLARDTKTRLGKLLDEHGTAQQLESVRYFYEHCYKLLESNTLYGWSEYNDFKEFASLLEKLCGPIHWRTTTLFIYLWIRWRENESRERTLTNIAKAMNMHAPDLISAFVYLLYARMPSEYQIPPLIRLFDDAIKATKLLAKDSDLSVPLRKSWFNSFTEYTDLHSDLNPSSAAASSTRAIAMCLCDPDFSSLRELLSSDKYQRSPGVVPTLSMTPTSSIMGFRPDSLHQSGSANSTHSRSMKDVSHNELPSTAMRRSWSSLGSGMLLGQRVSSLKSIYTNRSSRRTRDSKYLEKWDDDDEEDEDEDVKMTD